MFFRVSFLLLVLCSSVEAQDFPTRPITVVEPLLAGGGVDVMMRLYAEAAARDLSQRVIVENKTGSGGIVAGVTVKNAAPDGYTLFHANNGTQAILPAMRTVPYDPINDFEPITNLFTFAPYLVVPTSLQVTTAAELAALARKTPGGLRFATPGAGSSVHLLGAMWDNSANVPFQHVSYRGGAQVVTDLMTGRVDFTFSGLISMRDHIAAGQLRVLAIAGTKRELPDIPTMAEAGFPGIDADTWFGLAAPAGTPKPIIDRLNAAFVKATLEPVVQERSREVGYRITTSTPEEFRSMWLADRDRWR